MDALFISAPQISFRGHFNFGYHLEGLWIQFPHLSYSWGSYGTPTKSINYLPGIQVLGRVPRTLKWQVHPFNHCTPGLPGGSNGKESACNAGDLGSIPGLGRSPGGRHSNPLQYSCLENPMDRGAWRTIVRGLVKSRHDWATQHSTPTGFFCYKITSGFLLFGGDLVPAMLKSGDWVIP